MPLGASDLTEQFCAGDLAGLPEPAGRNLADRSVILRAGAALPATYGARALAGYLTRVKPTRFLLLSPQGGYWLNAVVVGDALVHVATGPAYVTDWWSTITSEHSSTLAVIGVALVAFSVGLRGGRSGRSRGTAWRWVTSNYSRVISSGDATLARIARPGSPDLINCGQRPVGRSMYPTSRIFGSSRQAR
jgi:hypothetical protein